MKNFGLLNLFHLTKDQLKCFKNFDANTYTRANTRARTKTGLPEAVFLVMLGNGYELVPSWARGIWENN